jgi:hypothetical protein
MDFTGEFKDTLGGGGFTGIHVSEDANVSVFAKVSHVSTLKLVNKSVATIAAFANSPLSSIDHQLA